MTEIDYDKLNEQAALLYDTAYQTGAAAGHSDGAAGQARQQARVLLELADTLVNLLVRTDETDENFVPLIIIAKSLISHTPHFDARQYIADASAHLDWHAPSKEKVRIAHEAIKEARACFA